MSTLIQSLYAPKGNDDAFVTSEEHPLIALHGSVCLS